MLDPTLVSILLGVLAVLGTLGGALGGTILANRQAMRLEELRIAQEKLKRDTAIIEEVYMLLTDIGTQIRDNINHERTPLQGKQLQDSLLRVQALINLYLPSLKEKLKTFIKALGQFLSEVDDEQQSNKPSQVWENVKESHNNYQMKLGELKNELENLVR